MTLSSFAPLLPLAIVALSAVLIMLTLAFQRNHTLTACLTLVGLGLAIAALFRMPPDSFQVTPLMVVDGYARFFTGLLLAASFAVVLFSHGYLERRSDSPEEFYLLVLLATLGSMVLVAASHFAAFFLGLEILSVSLYALIAYLRPETRGVEAGVKYLVLAAASSGFLLFGIALVYAETGTMEFARITSVSPLGSNVQNVVLLSGMAMIIVGFGFKLAIVPFHLWTPDVYEGAPAPVTAFVATVSKGAVFALLFRYFLLVRLQEYRSLFLVFALIAVASMIIGNLLALLQTNVKRILAYSSIAHLGYMLVAFLAGGPLAVTAVALYLVSYFVTTLGAFGVVTVLSGPARDADRIEDYAGLFRRRPWLAVIFTAMLLSLAGMPLTSGFVGKFFLVAAGVSSALWLVVLVLVLTSAIGLFYYVRIIAAMYVAAPQVDAAGGAVQMSRAGGLVLAVLVFLLVWLGVYPAPLIQFIQAVARIL